MAGIAALLLAALPGVAPAGEPPTPTPAPAPAPALAPAPASDRRYDLSCWQNGVLVIHEPDLTALPAGVTAVGLNRADGTGAELLLPLDTHGLCLLRVRLRPTGG